MAEPFEKS